MSELSDSILSILDKQTNSITIHDLVVFLPNYNPREIREELWSLTADGKAKFNWDWTIVKANDGGYF